MYENLSDTKKQLIARCWIKYHSIPKDELCLEKIKLSGGYRTLLSTDGDEWPYDADPEDILGGIRFRASELAYDIIMKILNSTDDDWDAQGNPIVKCGRGAPPSNGDLDFFVVNGVWYKIKDGTAIVDNQKVSVGPASSTRARVLPSGMRVYPVTHQTSIWYAFDFFQGGGTPVGYLRDLSNGTQNSEAQNSEDCSCLGVLAEQF